MGLVIQIHFVRIPGSYLSRVILGMRCPVSASYVRSALRQNGHKDVSIFRAYMEPKSYDIMLKQEL